MRKALFLGTGGLSGAAGVRANSKKERTAKAAEKQVQLLRGSQQPTRATRPSAQPSSAVKKGLKPKTWKDDAAYACLCALFGVLVAQGNTAGVVIGCLLGIGALVFAVRAYRHHPRQRSRREGEPVPVTGTIGVPAPSEAVKQDAPDKPNAVSGRRELAANVAQVPTTAAVGSTAGEIERLADLHGCGVLTDEEFAAAKSKMIERM